MIVASGNCHKSLGLGRIKPIFKGKGSSFNLVSYRPILVKNSGWNFVGNLFNASLERNLTSNIFACRILMGTEDAILRIREKIISESLKGNKIVVVAVDIKRAFEELPHEVVLKSISRTGASETTMNIIRSYLTSQASYVQVGEKKSKLIMNKSRGIGQGTHIAGPVFNIATIGITDKRRIE